ncbi:DUF732 domain-containing protein [Mycolicibacterium sp. 018/SC-01/001]|uniref:DUF732 domain-containing protein n=1 Tax=Mycolicibacterium sp. 018/SC-01/001 TaxID=2592069 RepID=UPI00117C5DAE|nr:DUF732 domain-containing protein [Mycolicibacterium sp. 018/SC-01/001]TRW77840.1 DUF732 domain-containing protein [Mycolicibacterium sp. 018/SC-01/001]
MPDVRALAAAVIACGAGLLMVSPTALADAGTFVEELTINNVWLPGKNTAEVIDAGYRTCGDLRSGVSVLDEMSRVENMYQFGQGTLFVSAASTHLCPDFAG